jgi:hypothetical protein
MCVARAFAYFALGPTSSKTVCELQALHTSNSDFPYSNFLMNSHPNIDVELSMDSFKLAFLCIFHLSICNPSNIIFQTFPNFFLLRGFNEWFHLTSLVEFPSGH